MNLAKELVRQCKPNGPVTIGSLGRTFQLSRLRRSVYHLRDLEISARSRFGTFREIQQDVEYVLANGVLPPAGPKTW